MNAPTALTSDTLVQEGLYSFRQEGDGTDVRSGFVGVRQTILHASAVDL